jgi:hypothetical protein
MSGNDRLSSAPFSCWPITEFRNCIPDRSIDTIKHDSGSATDRRRYHFRTFVKTLQFLKTTFDSAESSDNLSALFLETFRNVIVSELACHLTNSAFGYVRNLTEAERCHLLQGRRIPFLASPFHITPNFLLKYPANCSPACRAFSGAQIIGMIF